MIWIKDAMRIQFIELHEQPWLPTTIRDQVMDAMQFGLRLFRVYDPVIPSIVNLVEATHDRCVVDLCSGGGGPWFELAPKLDGAGIHRILLTDKFPNHDVSRRLRDSRQCLGKIRFYSNSVDAMQIPENVDGLRTMFSSFHHFPPDAAQEILQKAVDAGEGLGIFEVTKRSALTICLMFPWALMPLLFTPWIRPFRWSRLFWTYVVPIIPLMLLFDGIVSCLRTYRTRELRKMIDSLQGASYEWQIREVTSGWIPTPLFCLTGCPKHVAGEDAPPADDQGLQPENVSA
jgi:hypothetical protein